MTLTNPGAISNSGAKKFTNQFGSIAKLNYNRIQAMRSEYEIMEELRLINPSVVKNKRARKRKCRCPKSKK